MNTTRTKAIKRLLLLIFATCCLPNAVEGQDALIEWNVESGNYNDFNNWDPDVIPSDVFFEEASINNDGLAFVTDTPLSPVGLLIGRTSGKSGTVEIRSGGNLSINQGGDGSGPGRTLVGQNGTGHLTILPGGTLETVSLNSGGADESTLTIGGPGAGTASLSVLGNANLQRNTSLVGTNIDFSADTVTLGRDHQLSVQITPDGLTPINVANSVSMNGTLNVDFSGVTPVPGQTWDLFDAGEVRGGFQAFNASVGNGLGLFVTQTPGGTNGTLAQIGLEAQLLLSVDRGTGEVAIENRAAGNDLEIDLYGVLSPEGAIAPSNWTTLQAQDNTWRATMEPTSTHVAESNLSSSRVIVGESSIALGELYSFEPSELGVPYPELQFEYRLTATGEVRRGIVEMTGSENDVVLVVNPDTGATAIQNQSPFDLAIDFYAVLSDADSLNNDDWNSLQDGDANWREGNPASNHLAETNLTTTMPLPGMGDAISLGNAFAAGSERDLAFMFRLDTGELRHGTVVYGDPVEFGAQTCGDFDGDDDVDTADRNIQVTNWTGALPGGGTATFSQGDCDGDGDVDTADANGTITNWTGAMAAGNVTDGDEADLIYNPDSGNVTLDATDTNSGLFISFVLATDQNNLRNENFVEGQGNAGPFVDVGTNTDNTPFQIGQTDPLNQGAGPEVILGDIFPTGMDQASLAEYLTLAEYASELGSGGTFDLRVVPEPSGAIAGILALWSFALVCRRRNITRI